MTLKRTLLPKSAFAIGAKVRLEAQMNGAMMAARALFRLEKLSA